VVQGRADRPGRPRTGGGGGHWKRTPEQKAAQTARLRANAEAATEAMSHPQKKENRERLRRAISKHGIADIEEIIKRGPWQLVEVETKDGPEAIPLNEERSRLWQYAMNFAADRGGLPRANVVQLSGAETLGPIEVVFRNFERPADT
jgi:hypothetical protein